MVRSTSFTGLLRLTRYQDFLSFVVVTTLLGAVISGVRFNTGNLPRLLLVLVANCLAVGFAFMINDIEDARDDALSPVKAIRNPVSAGLISPPFAYTASFGVALLAGLAYYFLGPLPFGLGLFCLALGGLYSWRKVRLKSIPVLDLISHCLMLAGLQLWSAYFAFAPLSLHLTGPWLGPFLLVVSVSIYGELFNELRDLECDRKAGITHTAALVGERVAHLLMYALLLLGGLALAHSLATGLIPSWVVVLSLGLGAILLVGPVLKLKSKRGLAITGSLQQPVLLLGILVLLIWMLGVSLGI